MTVDAGDGGAAVRKTPSLPLVKAREDSLGSLSLRRQSALSSAGSLPPLTSSFQKALQKWDSYSEMPVASPDPTFVSEEVAKEQDAALVVLPQSQIQQQKQEEQQKSKLVPEPPSPQLSAGLPMQGQDGAMLAPGQTPRRRYSILSRVDRVDSDGRSHPETPPLVLPPERQRPVYIGPVMRFLLEKDPSRRTDEDRRVIFKFLSGLREFAKFPEYIRGALTRVVLFKRCEKEVIVFRQHEYGTAWYTVLSGSCVVSVDKGSGAPVPVSILGPGDSFGERALVKSSSRTATVTADEGTELLVVEKHDYVRTVKYAHEKDLVDKAEFLQKAPGLARISRKVLSDLASFLQAKRFAKGDVIVFEDDEPEAFYLVQSGTCAVLKAMQVDFPLSFIDYESKNIPSVAHGQQVRVERISRIVQIKTLGPGNYFGEIAILNGTKRSATVVAEEDVVLLTIPKFEFLRVCPADAVAVLRKNMAGYPQDNELEEKFIEMEQGIRWKRFKSTMVTQVLSKQQALQKRSLFRRAKRDAGAPQEIERMTLPPEY